MDEPRRRLAAEMSGLDVRYDLGDGHPLIGRRMPELDLVTDSGPLRVFTLLHDARALLLNLGEPGVFDVTSWADRVQSVDGKYVVTWELPAIGPITAPAAVLIRPSPKRTARRRAARQAHSLPLVRDFFEIACLA